MPLKTLVKVGSVTNLSDARYCSGMGTDMLGFCVIEDQPNYVSPQLYQEIRGWIAGPNVVAEVYGLKDTSALPLILENYRPHFVEGSVRELSYLKNLEEAKLIVSISDISEFEQIKSGQEKVAYLLIRDYDLKLIDAISPEFPIMVEIQSSDIVQRVLESPSVKGIALRGEAEIRPGLKNYDHLSEILEQLETD
jgi:phosphoribosylanthranilate isomerase